MLDVKSAPYKKSTLAKDGHPTDDRSLAVHTFGKTVASRPAKNRYRGLCIWLSKKIVAFLESQHADLDSGLKLQEAGRNPKKAGCANLKGRHRGKFMVYIQRDNQGYLLRVEMDPFEGMTDNLAIESEELQNWLRTREEMKARLTSLHSTDMEMGRVLEDVVSVLVEQGVIKYTDLPKAAREKLDQRAVARAEIEGLNDALNDNQ